MDSRLKDSGVDWIGKIPKSWSVQPISKMFTQRNTKVSDFDYAPLSVTKKGIVPQLDSAAKSDDHTNRKLVKKFDFVINSRSDRKMSSGVSQLDGSVSLINLVMKYDHKELYPAFVNYLMKNHGFAEEFYRWGNGIVADLWSTNWERGKKIQIPIPIFEEQQAIADFLDNKIAKIDEIIADTKLSLEKLKEYKRSVITEAVTRGVDSTVEMKKSGNDFIKEIPKNWTLKPLKIISESNLETISSKTDGDFEFDYVEIGSVTNENGIEKTEYTLFKNAPSRARRVAREGDVIISTVRTYLKAVARIEVSELIVSTGFSVLKAKKNEVNNEFLFYAIKSDFFTSLVSAIATGISYPAITNERLMNIKIPIPSFEEQFEIINFLNEKVSEIDLLIENKKSLISKYKDYKKSLIYEYVTGKKQVL